MVAGLSRAARSCEPLPSSPWGRGVRGRVPCAAHEASPLHALAAAQRRRAGLRRRALPHVDAFGTRAAQHRVTASTTTDSTAGARASAAPSPSPWRRRSFARRCAASLSGTSAPPAASTATPSSSIRCSAACPSTPGRRVDASTFREDRARAGGRTACFLRGGAGHGR